MTSSLGRIPTATAICKDLVGPITTPKQLDSTTVKTQNIALRSLNTVGSFFKKVGLSVLIFTASPILLLAGLAHATVKACASSSPSATWKKVTRYLFDTYFCKFSHATGFRAYTRCSDMKNGLFLGGMPTEGSFFKELKDKGIKTVISLNEDFELKTSSLISKPVTDDQWSTAHITFKNIPSPDFEAVPLKNLDAIADMIKESQDSSGPVYVHCKAGTGRSATAVIAYLIKYKNMTAEEAISYVQKRRPCVKLSHNHFTQVKKFALFYQVLKQGKNFHENLDKCNSLSAIRKLFLTNKLVTKANQYDVIPDSATVAGIKKTFKENPLTPRKDVTDLEKYQAAILLLLQQEDIQNALKTSSGFENIKKILQEKNAMIPWDKIPKEKLATLLLSKFSDVFSGEIIEKMLGITIDQANPITIDTGLSLCEDPELQAFFPVNSVVKEPKLEDHKDGILSILNDADFQQEYAAQTSPVPFEQIKNLLKKHGPDIPWDAFPKTNLIKFLLASV